MRFRISHSDREKHPERECGEPWVNWTWVRFPGTPRNRKEFDIELEAEKETDRDLTKSIPQLVCDFNFEAQKAEHTPLFTTELKGVLRAQARMVAMMAQVAMKPGVVEGTPGGMQYDKTWEDPLSPDVFEVDLTKPASEIYPTMAGQNEKIVFGKVGKFLKTEFESGFDKGDYSKRLQHYEKTVLEGSIFRNSDPMIQDEIRRIFAEAKGLTSKEALAKFWDRVEGFLVGVEIR
jgi:hypothetical protein